jgi:beta-glucosidase
MTPLELAHQTINKNEGGWADLPGILAEFGPTGIGTLFIDECMNKSAYGHANPAEWSTPLQALRARNALQATFLASSRLAIPVSFCMEGLHSGAWGGTAFPAPPSLAATWNASLVTLIGQAIAVEARASGVDTALAPVVNMFAEPRFGRYSEGFSPDPHVTAALGAAMVRGLQGGDNAGGASAYFPNFNTTVASQAKHFAAYGHAAGGLDGGVAELTNRSLFEIYLKPWRAMAACGLRSLMVAHQTVNDIPCHGNAWLINGVMRGEFGFDGVTISDEQNIPHLGPAGWAVAENITHAAAIALTSGVDLDLEAGPTNATLAYHFLLDALADGLISLADLQAAAARVLTLKFAAGLFDAPFAPEERLAQLQAPAHLALALDAARQSIVLAKNDGGLLPLAPAAAAPLKLALIGPFLDCAFSGPSGRARVGDPTPGFCTAREAMLGPYAQDNGQYAVPLLPEALSALGAPGLSWTVSQGASATARAANATLINAAVAAAADADVAVLVLGDALGTLDEGTSRSSLDLTPGQLALLAAVAAETTVPLVLVLLAGHPTSFGPGPNAVLGRVASVLIAQHPGQLGAQALAEVLVGATNPSGKLADSWPLTVGHLGAAAQPFQQLANGEWQGIARAPVDPDGRRYVPYWDDNYAPPVPQFSLGSGMSYTTFAYGGISVAQTTPLAALPRALSGRAALRAAAAATVVTATVRVCNTGARDGAEVVIVFARDPRGGTGGARRVVPYVKRIVGFARVPLAAGSCADAVVGVSADDLATYVTDYAGANLQLGVAPGTYVFSTGPSSREDVFNATLVVA